MKVDLREKDADGEGGQCSSGTADLLASKADISAENRKVECEDLGDPQLAFDLGIVGEIMGLDGCKVSVMSDIFKVPGVSALGQADSAQKIQIHK